MLDFITAEPNAPFTFSLILMLLITALELAGAFLGLGASQFLESFLPDTEAPPEAGADPGANIPTLSLVLTWLRIGQMPILILLMIFLTLFGVIGLGLQSAIKGFTGMFLPRSIAVLAALCVTLPCFRFSSGLLMRIAPKDETSAVSDASFVGRVATITIGTAKQGSAAEAKLQDQFGQTHYIMVVPDNDEDSFSQGEQVLLVRKTHAVFTVIAARHPSLTDS